MYKMNKFCSVLRVRTTVDQIEQAERDGVLGSLAVLHGVVRIGHNENLTFE